MLRKRFAYLVDGVHLVAKNWEGVEGTHILGSSVFIEHSVLEYKPATTPRSSHKHAEVPTHLGRGITSTHLWHGRNVLSFSKA